MAASSQVVGPQPLSQEQFDAKLSALDSVPLFMKFLPPDDSKDEPIAALQSLVYEGTPDEVARNFKNQGNDYFQGKRYREARGFYTQGIDAAPTNPILQEALLCNRAACNLQLQNYGSVLHDCSKVLAFNGRSSKAYYRSAAALISLGRAEEAVDCCDRCLSFDERNEGVLQIREQAIKAKRERDKMESDKAERLREEAIAKHRLQIAFSKRNLIHISDERGSSNPYAPHFDIKDPTYTTLVFPVFFLYPQYATSDIIQGFVEDTPFAAHLSAMFPPKAPPPEWDQKGEYIDGQLNVYATTHRKRVLKVGRNMSLLDVCKATKEKGGQRDGLELRDGCLTFVILPKGDVERKWVEEYKKTRSG